MLKIKKIVLAFALTSLITLLLSACAELDSHSSVSRFQRSENLYLSSLRWGEWSSYLYLLREKPTSTQSNKMVTLTDPETARKYEIVEDQTVIYDSSKSKKSSEAQQSSRDTLLDHLNTIKVSHTEVLESSFSTDEGIGQSRILIEYQFENSSKLNSLRYKVSWWHDNESNTWFSETPMPKEFEPPKAEPLKRKTIKLSPDQ